MIAFRHRNIAEWATAMRCRIAMKAASDRGRILRPPARFVIWGGRGGDIWVGGYCDDVVTSAAYGVVESVIAIYPKRLIKVAGRLLPVQEYNMGAGDYMARALRVATPEIREAIARAVEASAE